MRRIAMLLCLSAGPTSAAAQAPGTAPLVLRLPGGARALGVGDAWVAGRGAEVIFYNPAQLPVLRGSAISAQRFGSAATLGTFSTVGPFGKIWIGAGVQFLDYNPALGSSNSFTDPGELTRKGPTNASSLAATVAAALRFKGVRFGVSGKYVEERVGGQQGGRAVLDVGAAREFFRATFALSVQNLGDDITMNTGELARMPTRVTFGMSSPSIRVSTFFDFMFTASVARERNGRIVPAGGAELTYEPVGGWYFMARAGARRVKTTHLHDESPVTFGGSFGLDRFWLDYAFQPYEGPGAAHRVSIRIQ